MAEADHKSANSDLKPPGRGYGNIFLALEAANLMKNHRSAAKEMPPLEPRPS
ncbi:MAG TPA: hypothetical protein IGS52_05210 [Oscillatoriaceae cyanobacterium M33_DOE_052]|nr:hypothetical protein [Oscillatoriaceae cyanobacterium M33_DOE_052]